MALRPSDSAGLDARGSGIFLALSLLFCAGVARPCVAQSPRFDASQLACVRYVVHVHSKVTTDLQGHRRVEELDREGILSLRGTAGDSAIVVEAWWDSLALWRRADGRTLTPDPSGMLGGRYRGLLSPDGTFIRTAAPWVPDEVAEVSDLSLALDDLFPVFRDTDIKVLTDSGGAHRYRLHRGKDVDAPADSTRPFAVHELETSDGVLRWGGDGLIAWDRDVTAETRVTQGPRRNFRSAVVQRIELGWVGSCTGS